jgi:hypothetical protein
MEQKTFHDILLRFTSLPDKAKNGLKDKRLSKIEKDILLGYLLIRDSKNLEVINLFTNQVTHSSAYIEAHKNLLLGIAYNNLSQFKQAIVCYETAAQSFNQKVTNHFYFMTRINLYWAHYNLKDKEKMKDEISEIDKCEVDSETEILRVLRCKFSYAVFVEDFIAADNLIHKIEKFKDFMTEHFKSNFIIDKFNLELKRNNFKACQDCLAEMKKHRKYYFSSNYNFMKILLDHYLQSSPLYINNTDFKDSEDLLLQLQVIQKLQERNTATAKELWNKLRAFSNATYGEDFTYHGDRNLFSLCLEKQKYINGNLFSSDEDKEETIHLKNKVKKLYHIVKDLKGPISKEELFFLTWGENLKDKDDAAKLSHALSRIKREYGISLKIKKGCYWPNSENEAA